jgi:hypothetical protein
MSCRGLVEEEARRGEGEDGSWCLRYRKSVCVFDYRVEAEGEEEEEGVVVWFWCRRED